MNQKDIDIRWKQRFSNLTRSKGILDGISSVDFKTLGSVEIAGWLHIFDLTFELSWKTLHDYMLAQGESENMNFTREVLEVGFARGFIDDADVWIEMLADRNSSTHEYDEKNALEVLARIESKYLKEIQKLYEKLKSFT